MSRKLLTIVCTAVVLILTSTYMLLAQDGSTSTFLPIVTTGTSGTLPEEENRAEVQAAHHGNGWWKSRLPDELSDSDFVDGGAPDAAKVALGQFLFFDKILSGNQNISCASCHHPLAGTGDGLSLSVGEGARGLGVTRDSGTGIDAIFERVPRNAPPLFTLGIYEVTHMFHDGRVAVDANHPSGFQTPAGNDLPGNLENILAAQAMFPVTSGTEMAGQPGENEIADAAANDNLPLIWELLADRLRNIPEYAALFHEAYGIDADEITYAHAASAIAAFEIDAWRANNTPFDRYLRGNKRAMSIEAIRGMRLFYGRAECHTCHGGALLSDMDFHAIAVPQIGPGKGNGVDGREDFGRELVTDNPADRYRFRTPPLRNVALTGPWGHSGAFDSMEAILRHHGDPVQFISSYECATQPRFPSRDDLDAIDCLVQDDPARVERIAAANELDNPLSDWEIEQLMAFLHALTDENSLDLRDDVPAYVPSGLPLAE